MVWWFVGCGCWSGIEIFVGVVMGVSCEVSWVLKGVYFEGVFKYVMWMIKS